MVDDFDNRGQVASEGVVAVDHDDSAYLNEAPVGTLNNSVAHCAGYLAAVGQSRVLKSDAVLVQIICNRGDRCVHTLVSICCHVS